MSNVTDLLERLGSEARLRHANRDEIEAALRLSTLSPELQSCIANGDGKQLERLLGVDSNTCCLIEAV